MQHKKNKGGIRMKHEYNKISQRKDVILMMNRRIFRTVVSAFLTVFAVSVTFWLLYSFSFSWTKAEYDRRSELDEQGYSWKEVAMIIGIEFKSLVAGIEWAEAETYYLSEFGAFPDSYVPHSSASTTSESVIPVHTHTWRVDTTTDPTCAAEGSIVSVCDDCGKTKTEAVAKTEHEYKLSDSSAGNCMENQKETYTCAVCGDSYTVEGEPGEHDYVLQDNSIPAGCETEGLNVYQCSICGESYEETLAPLGHEYPKTKDVITEATCTESGLKAFRCIRCSLNSEEEEIPPTGHSTQYSVITSPTWFHDGKAADVCSDCMAFVTEYTLPAKIPVWTRVAAPVAVILLTGGIILIVRKVSRKKAAVA